MYPRDGRLVKQYVVHCVRGTYVAPSLSLWKESISQGTIYICIHTRLLIKRKLPWNSKLGGWVKMQNQMIIFCNNK